MCEIPIFGAALFEAVMEREQPSKRGKATSKRSKKEKKKKEDVDSDI
jgi:hypothetical protein